MEANWEKALRLLRAAVGDTQATFHPGQWEAIDALVNQRRKMLVVERTGWGKSSVYFIATRLLRDEGLGPTLIVSPLLALMNDQVASAARHGVRAISINSDNKEDWPALEQAIFLDRADALLVSPERLANEDFMTRVFPRIEDRIGMLVIDEAHCISDWGHDFRPDYQRLGSIRERMPPGTPLLATTATANDRVVADVEHQIGDVQVQRGPLARESLGLQTLRLGSQPERLAWLAEHLDELPGTGIIYTLTKADAERLAKWLDHQPHLRASAVAEGRRCVARPYYSGIKHPNFADSAAYRQRLERALNDNELKALVATTALGMGYDKPDLGFVVHFQAPGSVVSYYQQAGRAGRAIDRAVGLLMHGSEDGRILEYFRRSAFPDEHWVTDILKALDECDEGLGQRELEREMNLRRGQIRQALKFLSVANPAPIIYLDKRWRRTAKEYQMDRAHIERLTQQREQEWAEVERYVAAERCLARFLAESLDDPDALDCGQCAHCLGEPLVTTIVSEDVVLQAERFLRRQETQIKPKKRLDSSAFPVYGWKSLPEELRHQPGRVMADWGEGHVGAAVRQDKLEGRFRDQLVKDAAEMIQGRWLHGEDLGWVTCVPSHRHVSLVRDFAKRLADRLGVPFAPVVEKTRDNEPQKNQENSYHQCRNLDGAFRVVGSVPPKSVLLVDDVVDSGWTLAVTARLLLEAGSGAVYPFALARSTPGE